MSNELNTAIEGLHADLSRVKENPIGYFEAVNAIMNGYKHFLRSFGIGTSTTEIGLMMVHADVTKCGRSGELQGNKGWWKFIETMLDMEFMKGYIANELKGKTEEEINKGLQRWNKYNQKLEETK